ncbi:MAG TPA: hypothetical protein PKW42_02395 [bacterium]|nr:hypothetical protein [bacterium]
MVGLSHGQVNRRFNVTLQPHNVRAVTDTRQADRWVTRIPLPLGSLLRRSLSAGDTFSLNIVRVSDPALTGSGTIGIDSRVSFCTVHDEDQLAKIHPKPEEIFQVAGASLISRRWTFSALLAS